MVKSNWLKSKILITGANGFVGSNLSRHLASQGANIITTDLTGSVDIKCDLCSQKETRRLFDLTQPDTVFHLAAKVGGIYANVTQKADFYLINTLINTHVLAEVQYRGIKQVFAMGAGCAYPKKIEDQILSEENFLDGIPEVTNDAYAYSKRNMLVHLQTLAAQPMFRYLYFIPSNLYGPFDNFHPTHSHAVPGLINRFIQAKKDHLPFINIWGDGTARRDFLFIDDLISAMLIVCNHPINGPINIASGTLTSIKNLAESIAQQINYEGDIAYDSSYPEGQKQRTFNIDKISKLGWRAQYPLSQGLAATIAWYSDHVLSIKPIPQPQ